VVPYYPIRRSLSSRTTKQAGEIPTHIAVEDVGGVNDQQRVNKSTIPLNSALIIIPSLDPGGCCGGGHFDKPFTQKIGPKQVGGSVFPFDFRSAGSPTTQVLTRTVHARDMSSILADGLVYAQRAWLWHRASCGDAEPERNQKAKKSKLGPYSVET